MATSQDSFHFSNEAILALMLSFTSLTESREQDDDEVPKVHQVVPTLFHHLLREKEQFKVSFFVLLLGCRFGGGCRSSNNGRGDHCGRGTAKTNGTTPSHRDEDDASALLLRLLQGETDLLRYMFEFVYPPIATKYLQDEREFLYPVEYPLCCSGSSSSNHHHHHHHHEGRDSSKTIWVEALYRQGGWENCNGHASSNKHNGLAFAMTGCGSYSSKPMSGIGAGGGSNGDSHSSSSFQWHYKKWLEYAASLKNENGMYYTEGQLRCQLRKDQETFLLCGCHHHYPSHHSQACSSTGDSAHIGVREQQREEQEQPDPSSLSLSSFFSSSSSSLISSGNCNGSCLALPGDTIYWEIVLPHPPTPAVKPTEAVPGMIPDNCTKSTTTTTGSSAPRKRMALRCEPANDQELWERGYLLHPPTESCTTSDGEPWAAGYLSRQCSLYRRQQKNEF